MRIFRRLRWWLSVLFAPVAAEVEQEPGDAHALLSHVHQWDRCRYNGQYWYARCLAYEWCTARIAC